MVAGGAKSCCWPAPQRGRCKIIRTECLISARSAPVASGPEGGRQTTNLQATTTMMTLSAKRTDEEEGGDERLSRWHGH